MSKLAWHFLPADERLQFGRRSRVYVGQTLHRDPGKLSMCKYGLHASIDPFDALRYAPGPVICRVKLGGTILEQEDKCVASRRTVLWMRNIEKELRLFACWCVRNTPLTDGRVVWDLLTDKRSKNAVVVAERFANGDATHDELSAAWAAARDVAWDAAEEAASATSLGAAWEAASAAARDTDWAAARIAARAAILSASEEESLEMAWAAARNTAFSAAWGAHISGIELEEMERMDGERC